MDVRQQHWYLQVDTHFCRQVQLSLAHSPRRTEINLLILWSTWKPFICMATCLTQQQCWGVGRVSPDLSVYTFTLLHGWPLASSTSRINLTSWKKLCKHSPKNSFWKMPCHSPLIQKIRTYICDSFERVTEITVPLPSVTAPWLNATYVWFCVQLKRIKVLWLTSHWYEFKSCHTTDTYNSAADTQTLAGGRN